MKPLKFAVLIFATILSLNAIAREAVAIVNHDNIPVATNSGKTPSAEQIKQAIVTAAGTKSWSITPQTNGRLLATLHVRGKHTVVTEIAYASDKYSLTYKDSTDMKYGERDGQAVIHPFYNKWVLELKEAIRIELLKL
jgi:hypothetical protein